MPLPLPKEPGEIALTFPDGRIVPDNAQGGYKTAYSVFANFSDASGYFNLYTRGLADKAPCYQDDLDLFLGLNWIMRPPLTNLEILAMPNMEVVLLYYGLCTPTGYNAQQPNKTVSRGLPWGYALNHDRAIQYRIYNLRTDLHFVTDAAGQKFPVLLPPSEIQAPQMDETAVAIQALSAVLSIITFGAALWITLIATVATTTASAVNSMNIQATINQAQGQVRDVLNGIKVCKAIKPNPQLSPQGLQLLARQRDAWNAYSAKLSAASVQGLNSYRRMPRPAIVIPYFYQPDFDHRDLFFYYPTHNGAPCDVLHSQMIVGGKVMPYGYGGNLQTLYNTTHGKPTANLVCMRDRQQDAANRYLADWSPVGFFYSPAVEQMVNAAQYGSLPIPQAQLIG